MSDIFLGILTSDICNMCPSIKATDISPKWKAKCWISFSFSYL